MSSSQYQQVEASDEPTTPLNIESGTSSNNARNVENRNGKGCGSLGMWIYMILTLSMAIAIIFMKLESDHRYTSMQQQIIEMQRQLDNANSNELANLHAFQDSLISKENDFEERTQSSILSLSDIVQKQNRSYNYQYKDIVAKISTHDATLIKLTNGTSNAEVLDKLQWTKDHVANQMSETKAEVASKIQDVTRNVSLLIEDSHLQLQQTQSSISTFLNSTVNNMRAVMTTATNHIYEVQRNVTHAMNQTKINMERTVIELSQSVLKAQSTIQGEVSEVRDHIEAYVAVTNKQFAAENDFVKYQLAGKFSCILHYSSLFIFLVICTNIINLCCSIIVIAVSFVVSYLLSLRFLFGRIVHLDELFDIPLALNAAHAPLSQTRNSEAYYCHSMDGTRLWSNFVDIYDATQGREFLGHRSRLLRSLCCLYLCGNVGCYSRRWQISR